MLLSASGGMVMAGANDLIVLFLGLEVLSIAAYVLAAMHLRRVQSQEAGMKYFVLGAFSSAFLLYGIALVYGATGSTNLVDIRTFLATNVLVHDGMLLIGMALMLVGLGFKIAAVPFHSWSPDVYQGAPTPAVAFMAAAVKAASFAALLRVFVVALRALQRRLATGGLRAGGGDAARRLDARGRPDRRQAHAGVFVDQPRRLHPRRRRSRVGQGHGGVPLLSGRLHVHGDRQLRRRHPRRSHRRRAPLARRLPGSRLAPPACSRSRSRCCCWRRRACRSPRASSRSST